MKEIKIKTEQIQLDQLLKWANIVNSGGEAKMLIQSEQVFVNGILETRRSTKVKPGDEISLTSGVNFIIGREA